MNIKISKEEADILFDREENSHIIGSKLYGNQNEYSDTDHLIVYKSFDNNMDHVFQIRHQFQWDDEKNNADYIFTTHEQFWMNLFSGESTINADLILFSDFFDSTQEEKLTICKTYNVCKAYLGFAKRDIKLNRDNVKFKHIVRGLYTVSCLLDNRLPTLENIREISLNKDSKNKEELKAWQNELRIKCNKMYERDELKMYPVYIYDEKDNIHPLQVKLLESCNIKEFKYD